MRFRALANSAITPSAFRTDNPQSCAGTIALAYSKALPMERGRAKRRSPRSRKTHRYGAAVGRGDRTQRPSGDGFHDNQRTVGQQCRGITGAHLRTGAPTTAPSSRGAAAYSSHVRMHGTGALIHVWWQKVPPLGTIAYLVHPDRRRVWHLLICQPYGTAGGGPDRPTGRGGSFNSVRWPLLSPTNRSSWDELAGSFSTWLSANATSRLGPAPG